MILLAQVAACLLLSGAPGGNGVTAPEDLGEGAQASDPSPATSTPKGALDDGRRTFSRLPANLLRGTLGVFGRENLRPLLIGGAATGLGSTLDNNLKDRIADPNHSFATAFENLGDPLRNGVMVTGLYAVSRLTEHEKFRAVSYDLLDAVIVNWAYTTAIKNIVHRERPNGEDNVSFPSGHASNAFVIASVVDRHFGWKGGLPAYAYATAVAASRLQRNKHYLSDVLGGATLGYLVGRSVVRVNTRPLNRPKAAEISLTPILGPDARGISFGLSF